MNIAVFLLIASFFAFCLDFNPYLINDFGGPKVKEIRSYNLRMWVYGLVAFFSILYLLY